MSSVAVGWKGSVVDRRIASFRYRVERPVEALKTRGHDVELFNPADEDRYGIVVFSKAYSAEDRRAAARIAKRGGRVIFDLCDNHFYNPFELPRYRRAREEILEMISIANRVTCTTEALSQIIVDETRGAVTPTVIGDAFETTGAKRRRRDKGEKPLELLWFGSHGSPNAPCGMTDLLLIQEELEALAAKTPARLLVCSNNPEKFADKIAPMKIPTDYVEWSEDAQAAALASADAVLLPVTRNPFTDCKSHNRLTSAIGAGVPALATGIQSYLEFEPYCHLDDWSEGLSSLASDYEDQKARAMRSRRYLEKVWSMPALMPQWEEALGLPAPAARERRVRRLGKSARQVFQGRLDAVATDTLTGWVRNTQSPGRKLEVALECDGEIVANAVADLPREDLRAVGIAQADCGFSISLRLIKVPPGARIRVLVAGADWLVGENPIILREDVAMGLTQTRPAPSASPVPDKGALTRLPVETAVESQEQLQRNLEAVMALTGDLRRLLARSVIATAESPEMADRLSAAIGLAEDHRSKGHSA